MDEEKHKHKNNIERGEHKRHKHHKHEEGGSNDRFEIDEKIRDGNDSQRKAAFEDLLDRYTKAPKDDKDRKGGHDVVDNGKKDGDKQNQPKRLSKHHKKIPDDDKGVRTGGHHEVDNRRRDDERNNQVKKLEKKSHKSHSKKKAKEEDDDDEDL